MAEEYDEAMNVPMTTRSKNVAWQVESELANELMRDFGWFKIIKEEKDGDGNLTGIKVRWVEYGNKQLVSAYGANKIYINLKVFLNKELPLTKWEESIIKNTILNHINEMTVDLALDENMGVRDEDLDIVIELLKTLFRVQAYKARDGFFMEKLGEEKRVLVTEKREQEKTGFFPWNKGKGGTEQYVG